MSAVVGVDLSTKALDLVKLDESSNRAEWVRCELDGRNAWGRTLGVRWNMRDRALSAVGAFWDDVYLVALEAPYGHGSDLLNRVVGAVAASLPAALRSPERCWIVRPDEWKHGLGLKEKPSWGDLFMLLGYYPDIHGTSYARLQKQFTYVDEIEQHARDAYCLALWAREENRKGVAAA